MSHGRQCCRTRSALRCIGACSKPSHGLRVHHEGGPHSRNIPTESFHGNEVFLKLRQKRPTHLISSLCPKPILPLIFSFFLYVARRTAAMSLSSTITLPSSSARALYSYGRMLPRASSPATFNYTLSPPVSPPNSPPPSMMITLPASSANGFYLSWQHRAEIPSPTGSGSLSPAMSRPSSPLPLPLQTISQVFGQRASWPVSHPIAERQISDSTSDSRPTSLSTSVSYAYTVKSINSRKSRLTVLYPRPVRPQRVSGVGSIHESECTSLESLIALSSRPVSMSMPPPENPTPVADKEVRGSRRGEPAL